MRGPRSKKKTTVQAWYNTHVLTHAYARARTHTPTQVSKRDYAKKGCNNALLMPVAD